MDKSNSIIGVYDTHAQAIEALKILQRHNFPLKHVALLGKGEAVQEINGVHTWEEATTKGTEIGALVGGTLGVLAGLSLITVPGIGLVYLGTTVGAILAGVEGTAVGSMGGLILGSIFGAKYGTEGMVFGKPDKEDFEKYQEEIKNGKFLIIVHGPEAEVQQGHDILTSESHFDHVTSVGGL